MRPSFNAAHYFLVTFVALVANAFPFADSAQAFDIEERRWGYDGTVYSHEINPLFLRLRNNTGEAEEFTLSLKQKSYGTREVGALISVAEEQSTLFLSPFSERWVTFYIYIRPGSNDVQLYQGRDRVGKAIPIATRNQSSGERPDHMSRVLFTANEEFDLNQKSQLKRFPSDIFPPNITGTDTLEAVFLDHEPRWQPEQRKTFMRWLQRGGTLHLLQSRSGTYPSFTEELSVLNGSLDHQYIGNGIVVRHPIQQNRLDKETLADIQKQELALFGIEQPEIENQQNDYGYFNYEGNVAESMFPALKQYVNPNHNWPVMYLISFLYLFAVFPGAWLVNKKWNDFRITYGSLLLSVLLFSLFYNMVGARGYGESTQINSIAVARVLPHNELDVTQYSNAFVTSGDQYRLEHKGNGVIYTTASDEDVLGKVQLGPQANFIVDIPPFSSRPFMHRTLIHEPAPAVELTAFDVKVGLKSLQLKINGIGTDSVVWAANGDWISKLSPNNGVWTSKKDSKTIQEFADHQDYNQSRFYGSAIEPAEVHQIDNNLLRNSISKSLRLRRGYDGMYMSLKQDRIYVFVQSNLPPALECANENFLKQTGKLVYQYELILSE
ncbi:hypothetical protein Pla110_04870 [Polystyrenella longa]|uniref:DUF4350 domain-containing protein n=2 Tax=Polystyrenella longa TaxID=2528007 RepID=A0A518CHS8_9PLAN|nr:hypothetical protein Pla110_04870 [Polystyrenella longa]